MPRNRRQHPATRKNLHLRTDLVEWVEGVILLRPEESRVGYGFNEFVNELIEERKLRVEAAQAAAMAEGFAPSS